MTSLKEFNRKQMADLFDDFRSNNKISDENKLRKSMIFSIMKTYMDRLVNEDHKTVGSSITIITNMLNDFAASNQDYLSASTYKTIIKELKEYSVKLQDNIPYLIDKEFLSRLNVSKTNALSESENPSAQLKEAVCEGYRKEIMDKLYKSNNDLWFKK